MVVGTTLLKLDGNPYYSPQFPRAGLSATFSADVSHVDTGASLSITIQHRNSEDTTWTDLGSFSSITAVGTEQLDLSALLEIVRIKYVIGGGSSSSGVHFLMQAPSWRPY